MHRDGRPVVTGDALARLRQALDDHGCVPRGNAARCPAHDDRQASLSIGQGRDGAVLKCHRECATADVLAALGMTSADLFDEPRQAERGGDVLAAYRYTDEGGELLYEVLRKPGKKFTQRCPDGRGGWIWNLGTTRRVLYRLAAVIAAVAAGEVIYVAEGEKDVHALEAAGVTATCNSGGAGKWRPEFASVFRGATVIIIADKDGAGIKHAREVAANIKFGGAAAVEIRQAAEGKDAADHLDAGWSLADFRPVPDTVSDNSPPVSEAKGTLASGSDSSDTSDSTTDGELLAGVRDGAWLTAQQFPPLRFAVPGLVPEGFSLLIGAPKIGKSWLVLDLLLGIANGDVALGKIRTGAARRVLYLALEDSDRRMQDRCRVLLGPGEDIPALFSARPGSRPGWCWPRSQPGCAGIPIPRSW
jgi:hypothetical protein